MSGARNYTVGYESYLATDLDETVLVGHTEKRIR